MKSRGEQIRNWCYVVDCASAILFVLLKGERNQVYNVADRNSNVSIKEMAEIIAEIGNRKVVSEVPDNKEKKGHSVVSKSVFSTLKLQQLGWIPKHTMREGLISTLEESILFFFMKILHISTTDDAGAGQCCLRIHQSLLDAGIDSKMVVLKNTQHSEEEYQYGYYRDKMSKLPSKILSIFELNLTERNEINSLNKKYLGAYTRPVSSIDLTKCEWVGWADIINLHWVNDYLDYPSFLMKIKKPIVWTLHDEGFFYGIAHHHNCILADNRLEKKYRKIKYNAIRSAENLSIVFLSQMINTNFVNEKIIEGYKKTIIPNSVNTQVFQPHDRVSMRRKYGLNEEKRYFVFISLNVADPNKGLDLLSDALDNLDTSFEILAIGNNPLKKQWKNVHSVGLVKDQQTMSELISSANYMAMPSFQEAFPQSPMEAMACGLPVVAFPVSGTSELINNENGVICDDFTREALTTGIETLLSRHYDPVEIRNNMVNRFSPKAVAEKYINLYNKILL